MKLKTKCFCKKKNKSCRKHNVNQFVLQARVLATIGVTRGLGDHDLKVHDSNIYIKPFLSCCPEVSALAAHKQLIQIQSLNT